MRTVANPKDAPAWHEDATTDRGDRVDEELHEDVVHVVRGVVDVNLAQPTPPCMREVDHDGENRY